MGRPRKKDDEADFSEEGKFSDDAPVPGKGHNIAEMNEAISAAEEKWKSIRDEVQALHDDKKAMFAELKAEYGLKRSDLERGFKRKLMDPDERAAQDESDAIINEALGVPSHAWQPDMFGGQDTPVSEAFN